MKFETPDIDPGFYALPPGKKGGGWMKPLSGMMNPKSNILALFYAILLLICWIAFAPTSILIGSQFYSYHPIGFDISPSPSGRTHYLILRPYSNNFSPWLDLRIPVTMKKTYTVTELP